jgi:hypothetical protein
MYPAKLLCAHFLDFVPRRDFDACLRPKGGGSRPRDFSSRDLFLGLAFAQRTILESVCDTKMCLRALDSDLSEIPLVRTLIYAHANHFDGISHRSRPRHHERSG